MATGEPHHGQKFMPIMYANIFALIKPIAEKYGYALAVHGSFTRDMDLIAVAWTEKTESHIDMLREMAAAIGETDSFDPYHPDWHCEKPHGRIAYNIVIGGGGFIDISVIAPEKFRVK